MNKILVPTDFSANANKALDFAVHIAKRAKAEIILVHACNLIATNFTDCHTIKREHNEALLHNANKELALLKASIEESEAIPVTLKIYNGNVTDGILQAVEETSGDFIVIGTRGEMPLNERILGSTASHLLGKTKVPLLVISPLSEWDTTGNSIVKTMPGEHESSALRSILFATNHFERNKDLLYPVINVARLFSSVINVAVFVDTDFADAFDYVYNMRELDSYLHFLKETYPDVLFKGQLLEGEDFESTIEKYNEENSVDLIAMVTYPKNFWDRLLKKKVTKNMAFHSKTPVMAVAAKYY